MIKAKKISKFLEKQWSEMNDNLASLCKNWDGKTLHALRVNTKRVKAIISLLKTCLPHKKFSVKKLKELFNNAGAIRTAQLNLEMAQEYQIENLEFIEEQNRIIQRESKTLCDRKERYETSIKKLRKRIAANLSGIENDCVISYYFISIKELSVHFSSVVDESHLHDCRKLIKKILLALKSLPTFITNKINLNKNYLDELQEVIGKWHDVIITLELLSNAGITEGPGVSSLIYQKQKLLEEIKKLTSIFDTEVMFAKH